MTSTTQFHVSAGWQPAIRDIGLDADAVFAHPAIRSWRQLPDRENCTLDADLSDGRHVRLHVKRYAPWRRSPSPAEEEVAGHQLLLDGGIPTANLVAWGTLADGRSCTLFEDLAGFTPADKLVESGTSFSLIQQAAADMAARIHQAGLHHRDLYLCHLMVKLDGESPDIRVIDAGRVRKLPAFFARGRWIVKDLAQFWYSTLKLPVSEAERTAWLLRYCQQRQLPGTALMRGKIESKVKRISKHDAKLNMLQPTRNVSLPW